MEEQIGRPAPGEERTFAQLPVCLPQAAELTAAVGASRVVSGLQADIDTVAAGDERPELRNTITTGISDRGPELLLDDALLLTPEGWARRSSAVCA
jgi:hypothetical protein